MSLSRKNKPSPAVGRKVWAIAWPVSLTIHVAAFAILYMVFAPMADPLARANAIRQMRFAKESEKLRDRPVIRSQSTAGLSSLLEAPATQNLAPPQVGSRLADGARIIGLDSAQDSAGSAAIFSTAVPQAPPLVSFFGSSASGYKIVFVVDRSGSMWDQFALVREELLNALAGLEPSQQFQLIFFSSGQPLQIKPLAFLPASPSNKQLAYDFLQEIARLDPVSGATDPAPALTAALSLSDGPADVVFFLSDGDFPHEVLNVIKQDNPQGRTQIHTIGFGYQGGTELLRRIASANQGSFRFVPASTYSHQTGSALDSLLP